ncbi:ATP-binding protein [Bacteroides fragilis]
MSEAVNTAKTFSRNAKGVTEILSMKFETLPFEGAWYDAFGTPERRGVWMVWGNTGSGKTSFVMRLCKELCKYGRVVYNSLEEGVCLTTQNTLRRFGMGEVNRRFLLTCEPLEQLSLRMKRQKSPDFVVIDSFQYTQMTYPQYIKFKERHRNKLIIFISHACGQNPDGRSAKKVAYDASLKIYVEGMRALSKGRFIGPKGYFDIWPEEAARYYGEDVLNSDESLTEQENEDNEG